ncbi:MAG: DMT family transporter [Nocardioidaceae bacterium]
MTSADDTPPAPSSTLVRDGTWLIAIAAALWGTDALFRLPLTEVLSAPTIVLAEHAVLVALTLPWLPRAVSAARRTCRAREWVALVLIGVGASATATILFTLAFEYGGPVTPVALQKMQPLFAAGAACLLLRERLRPRYAAFLAVALASAWLLSFADPFQVTVTGVLAALLALGAAALWAGGTVAGRLVSHRLDYTSITVLRFAFGLPAALVIALVLRERLVPPASDVPALVALSLVPGLAALMLYYRGLRSTPASRATVAELAFPATAAFVGVAVLGAPLTATQWAGLLLLVVTVAGFAGHERRSRRPAVVDRTERVAEPV